MINSYHTQFDSLKPARLTFAQAPSATQKQPTQQAQKGAEGADGEDEKRETLLNQGANWIGRQIGDGIRASLKFVLSDSNPLMRVIRYHKFPPHQIPFKNQIIQKAQAVGSLGKGLGQAAYAPITATNISASFPLDFIDAPWKVGENINERMGKLAEKPKESFVNAVSNIRQGLKQLIGMK